MTARSNVFIASSSEGLELATVVRQLLLTELESVAQIQPWTRAFELSATYIESLEKIVAAADFAILVLTPDDLTHSRSIETLSPRDNVVFELGLFMGGLGRERCIVVHESRPDLKLPSDLLGVRAATFKRPADGNLKAALDAKCALIAERVIALGARHKVDPAIVAARSADRLFFERLQGAWWERISVTGRHTLCFLQIEWNAALDAAELRGDTFDDQGQLTSHWSGVVMRILREERKILYHWQGWYPNSPQDRFHGFGEFEFELPAATAEVPTRGRGRFWDVDETRPGNTIIKSAQLRRVRDAVELAAMTDGRDRNLQPMIVTRLRAW